MEASGMNQVQLSCLEHRLQQTEARCVKGFCMDQNHHHLVSSQAMSVSSVVGIQDGLGVYTIRIHARWVAGGLVANSVS